MEISKEKLVNIINAAIEYGGDCGGPYFDSDGHKCLVKELKDVGLTISKYERKGYGWLEELEELVNENN